MFIFRILLGIIWIAILTTLFVLGVSFVSGMLYLIVMLLAPVLPYLLVAAILVMLFLIVEE